MSQTRPFSEGDHGAPFARGAAYSLLPWLVEQLVVMPMMGAGLFSGSALAAGTSLMGHLVYGAILGRVYGKEYEIEHVPGDQRHVHAGARAGVPSPTHQRVTGTREQPCDSVASTDDATPLAAACGRRGLRVAGGRPSRGRSCASAALHFATLRGQNGNALRFRLVLEDGSEERLEGETIRAHRKGPAMQNAFDLVVIGTGTAGSVAASSCRAAGWSVAIVDSRPFGGTCALRGCDPKKVLVGASEAVDWVRRMNGQGIDPGGVHIDWAELMRFKRTFVEPVAAAKERAFARAGIVPFRGRARFADPTTIQIGEHRLRGRHVLIASGAMPARLRFPGAEHLIDSTRFLELESLPKRIVFVGGGYISFEFAHVAQRAGAEAHILHRGERPLERFDPDLVSRLVDATRTLGIHVHLNTEVRGIEKTGGGVRVITSLGGAIEADMAVHGAGREPEIHDLGLEAVGIERNPDGIVVNEYLQSVSNHAVYAAGDAAATAAPKLTPVSSMHGHVIASNLLKGNHRRPDHSEVPSIVFTVPPLASVGLGEQAAHERGLAFDVRHEDTSGWYSSRRVGMKHSAFKVLVERGTDRILGAHVLGMEAEQVINLFAVAMRAKMTAAEIKQTIFAYPTGASDVSYMV